jgi:hypothetical protein
MTYSIQQGIQVSVDNVNWYKITDHNRQPIGINYTLIEQTDRMANGTLRKYVVARKFNITANWQNLPTLDSNLVDFNAGAHGAAWMKAFYERNYGSPVYVRIISAQDVGYTSADPKIPDAASYLDSRSNDGSSQTYTAFMTTFTYDISKRRMGYDYVDLKIEFTEI